MADLTLGKIQAALASANNEVTLTAANLNLDFTLVKFEAPKEFQPLSSVLTFSRRREAELGPTHVIARRLAALFEGVNVPTPELLKAYGTRVSEISLEVGRATTGSRSSIFSEYLGIDATSIWAAATSSEAGGSVQVHLLACLIARMWNPPEAVSIWDEIVACRRREIAQRLDNGSQVPAAMLYAAAQQEIPRDGLALWDASARSWLRTADSAKEKEQKQCSLILKNVNLAVNNEAQLYSSVMHAWTTGMRTLDKILSGTPVEVRDGALLLAMSSWHIYLDMMIYGLEGRHQLRAEVMEDPLISPGGMVTLGLSRLSDPDVNAEALGVYWSVPLERFKFYGKAVQRTRNLQDDASRLSFKELLLANLGAILGRWRIPKSQWTEFIQIIVQIITVCNRRRNLQGNIPEDWFPQRKMWEWGLQPSFSRPPDIIPERNWTDILLRPAMEYLQEPDVKGPPMALGARRTEFIEVRMTRGAETDWPFLFGICESIEVMQKLITSFENVVKFLQYFLESRGVDVAEAIVVSRHSRFFTGVERDFEEGTKYIKLDAMWIVRAKSARLIPSALNDCNSQPETEIIELRYSWKKGTKLPAEWEEGSESLPDIFVGADGREYHALAGNRSIAAVYVDSGQWQSMLATGIHSQLQFSIKDLSWAIQAKLIPAEELSGRFDWPGATHEGWRKHIDFLYSLSKTYLSDSMNGATISCRILQAPLETPWAGRPSLATTHHDEISDATLRALCYFESGSIDIKQHDSSRIIGFSSRDSLFVRSELTLDPHHHKIRLEKGILFTKLLGNVGKPGLTLLTCPENLMIREVDPGSWRMATHADFDGQLEDCFNNTSIHLNVLDWCLPLTSDDSYGQYTLEASIAEAVLRVHDRGRWVGDIDIFNALSQMQIKYSDLTCLARHPHVNKPVPEDRMTSLDTWDEILDSPRDGLLVIRTRGNWIARLAVIGILHVLTKERKAARSIGNQAITLCPKKTDTQVCWKCLIPKAYLNSYGGQVSGENDIFIL